MKRKTRFISFIMTIALILSLGSASFASADMPAPVPIIVTYDPQGGALVPGSETENVYTGFYNAIPTTSREGYTFGGWWTGSGGSGVQVEQGNSLISPIDHILCAKWVPNTYTVYFDAQGGSGDAEDYSKTIPYGSPYGDLPPEPTRLGYTFDGWYPEPNGTGERVTENTQTTITADHTLYAKWNANTYAINFDLQGGNLIPEDTSKTVEYEKTYGTLPMAEKATYIFGGWFTEPEGAGTEVTSTTQVTIADSQTLYAHWTRPTITVTFDLQDGTGATFTRSLTYGDTYHILDWPTRPGYVLYGWYTEPNGGGIQHNASTPISTPHDYTLYAKWTANSYTVTLDPQGGEVSQATQSCQFGSAYGPLPITTRPNYTFAGWYTASGNNGTLVTAETTVSTSYDHTLYAKWTGNTYTVTLYPQDAAIATTTQYCNFGSPYGDLPTPTRPSYRFEGWYETSDYSGTPITGTTTVLTPNNHTLYAKWTPANIAVTFDLQGGEMEQTTLYYNLGEQYGTLSEPTRTGYEFFGWCTTPGVSSTWVRNTSIVSIPNDHTLYAYWVRIIYAITFDTQGGTLMYGSSPKYISYGNTYDLPYASKENYAFGGWWTEPYGRGTQIQSNMKPTADRTLYAYWTYDYGPSLPPVHIPTPPPPPPPPLTPPPMTRPGNSENSGYIMPPPPPLPPQAPPGITPNIIMRNIQQDGTPRVIPGNFDQSTGQFNFLYDVLPEDTGSNGFTTDYDATPPSGISQDHWAYQNAARLLSQGILGGGPITPGAAMTRGELIAMLYRVIAFPLNPTGRQGFSDTTSNDTPINWAAERGIVNGLPDGTFRPDAEITRQETFALIARFLEAYGIEPPDTGAENAPQEFSDTGDIDDWAFGDVERTIRYGLISGMPGDNGPALNPLRQITQEELIALISRMIDICY